MAPGGVTVSPLNIHGWRSFPLRGRLADLTGLPVAVDNDAKALALGEGWRGAAQGSTDYLAMVVSTGVGGGIVLDGRLLDGSGGNAGHIGHVVVEPDGRPCACGGRGCLEAEASGTAIAAVTGRPAAEADAATRRRCGTLVGRAVASVANLCDLQLAVVAGSVALGYGDDFFAAARDELHLRCGLDYARSTRIEPAGLGADGPLIGAAAVARHRHGVAGGGRMTSDSPPAAMTRRDITASDRGGGASSRPVVDRTRGVAASRPPVVVADLAPPAAARPAPVGVPHGDRLREAGCGAGAGRRDLVPGVVPVDRRSRIPTHVDGHG